MNLSILVLALSQHRGECECQKNLSQHRLFHVRKALDMDLVMDYTIIIQEEICWLGQAHHHVTYCDEFWGQNQ